LSAFGNQSNSDTMLLCGIQLANLFNTGCIARLLWIKILRHFRSLIWLGYTYVRVK